MPETQLIGGRYRLGPAIGSGGMGTVRRARDLRFDRDVAVKLLRATDDPRHQERMRREVRLLGALQHPNLVAAYDTGIDLVESAPVQWLAMELVRGPDLGVLLRQRGHLPTEDVRRIVHDVAEALVALHGSGVVHRDLKPANVLLTREPGERPWHAKVADLGVALTEDAAGFTTTGQVMGTAAYLSPEQVSGEEVDAATDVYALGLVAIEALAGAHPFPGGAVEAATARLVRPPKVPGWLPVEWRVLLEAMTTIDPGTRPSAGQVARATATPMPVAEPPTEEQAAFAAAFDDVPTEPAEVLARTSVLPAIAATEAVEAHPAPRRRVPLAVAAAVVLGLVGGGAALLAGAPHPQATPSATHRPSAAAVVRAPTPSVTRTITVVRTAAPAPVAASSKAAPAPVHHGPGNGHGGGSGKGHGKGKGKG